MITVYTSTAASPASAQVPFEIDLSGGATLPQDVQLYAAAVDSEDPAASFAFSWHLLRKPTGSSAALDSAIIAEPTLEGVDVWGDYHLFCIATNTGSGATSQRDPLQAGASAFTRVYVRSENLALVKPAAGERDWFTHAYEWVDALENVGADIADHETRITALEDLSLVFSLSDLDDVSLSTPTTGESLVYNGTAWVNQVVSGGGSGGTLTVDADGDSGSVDLTTELLAFTGSDGVQITGSSATAGQFTIDIGLDSTLAVDISGEAATAVYAATSGRADEANFLTTPNVLSLGGDLSGSATIGGLSSTPTLTATIVSGAVENTMLANSSITFGNETASEAVQLGESVNFYGTSGEVEVDYNTTNNRFTIGLPSTITVNASSATALQTTRTIALTGGATGSATFNGTANASITTTLATPTTSVRGGVLLDQVTAYGNSGGYLLNRERLVFSTMVDFTHYETSTIAAHISDIDGISADQSLLTNIGLRSIAIFKNPFKTTMHIDQWNAVIGFGGVEGGDGEYELELVTYANIAAVRANTHSATGETLTLTGTDNSPKADEADFSAELTGPTVGSGGYFGVVVNNATKNLGHQLSIQIVASRAIGDGDY